jgi:hypothetical protein
MIPKVIHCIGDSHADFFSGWNFVGPAYPKIGRGRLVFFQSYRLDAVLAYSLCKSDTGMRGREKLMELAKTKLPPGSRLMLCFGEIDCRAHLLKQAELRQVPIEEVVRECVDRYFGVIQEIRALGFQIFIWNVVASSRYVDLYQEFPTFGDCLERNQATRLFNDYLKGLCEKNNIIFVSIFNKLINKRGLTKMSYYMDSIHLSQTAMPLALRELSHQTKENFSETVRDKIKLFFSEIKDLGFFRRLIKKIRVK